MRQNYYTFYRQMPAHGNVAQLGNLPSKKCSNPLETVVPVKQMFSVHILSAETCRFPSTNTRGVSLLRGVSAVL